MIFLKKPYFLLCLLVVLLLILINGSVVIVAKPIRFFLFVGMIVINVVLWVRVGACQQTMIKFHLRLFCILLFLASPLVYAYGVAYTLITCDDGRFECLDKVAYKNGAIVAYLKVGWAFTSSGVLVRKELPVLPGVLYVEEVRSFYPKSDIQLRMKGDTLLLMDREYHYDFSSGNTKTVESSEVFERVVMR